MSMRFCFQICVFSFIFCHYVEAQFLAGNSGWPPSGNVIPRVTAHAPRCSAIKSINCEKYGFNVTMFPTFLGHLNVEAADALLTHTFKNTIVCPIPRQSAELIGCAIILPLCEMGKKVPPCQEDCTDVITQCRVNQSPGYEMSLRICTLFPKRLSGINCIRI
ncbi:carboxypeptidase Z-like [Mytilus trossulus]|uniref:carboxypeptidase Z-like n=1 Tax=Mytilus trossulus TaxID=6551 RepID=UPI003003CB97